MFRPHDTAVRSFDEHTRALVRRAAGFLLDRRVPAYLVGGAVRDAMLATVTRDVDIAIDASPHQLGQPLADLLGGQLVSLDAGRDIVRVVIGPEPPRVFIDLSGLDGSIHDDLRRRDFTADAIAIELGAALDGAWLPIDPFGGVEDISGRTIRAVSDSVFRDDPLRLMRAVRLAAETGFSIEPGTESLVRRDVGLLPLASPERIREELLRTLAAGEAGRWIGLMDDLGILSALMPELDRARGVEQPKEHYYDVFGHLKSAAAYADQIVTGRFQPDFIGEMLPRFEGLEAHLRQEVSDGHTRGTFLKLTALLHDVAKPDTKTVEPTGRVRFFGHSEKGDAMAGGILRRLRVGRRGVRHVRAMVRHHLRPRQMASSGQLPTDRAIHRYYRDLGAVALDTLYLNMADFLAARGPLLTRAELEEQVRVIGHILAVGPPRPARSTAAARLLTGHDIMREFCLPSSPTVGRILRAVSSAEANGQVSSREEALELARTHLKRGGLGG